jgi:hypothetical protein
VILADIMNLVEKNVVSVIFSCRKVILLSVILEGFQHLTNEYLHISQFVADYLSVRVLHHLAAGTKL